MSGTYGDLQDRIADELLRSDLTSEIQLEILSAIKHYERQSFWFNESRATMSLVANTPNYAVPTDLLVPISLTITYNNHPYEMHFRTWGWYRAIHGDDVFIGKSVPTDWAYFANQMWVYPIPNSNYTLTLAYIQQLATLSARSDSNEWMIGGEELIRSRAKANVAVRYLNHPFFIAERDAMQGSDFLSTEEKIAYESLVGTAADRTGTGYIQPFAF